MVEKTDNVLITEEAYRILSIEYNNQSLKINNKLLYSTIVLNAILAIATILIDVDTHRLVKSASDQVDQAKSQVEQAQAQVKEAHSSNIISVDNSKKAIRPYVLIKDITTQKIPTVEMESSIILKNGGQTPAFEAWGFSGSAILPLEGGKIILSAHHLRNCSEQDESNGKYYMLPGEELPVVNAQKFDKNFVNTVDKFADKDIADFKSGKSGYIIRGLECYTDIFKDTHSTYFCRYYTSLDHLLRNVWTACKEENDIN